MGEVTLKNKQKIRFKRFRKDLKKYFFVFSLMFSLLYVEFVFFVNSASTGPLEGLAVYLNPEGNEIENAVGRLAITDEAHLLVKGEGKFELKIYDSEGRLVLTRRGRFNNTGFADISFQLSPEKFKVNKEYVVVLEAFNEPLPLILKCGKTKIRFKVKRDITKLGIGFYKNPVTNETTVFAKLMDEINPIAGRKIRLEYKLYASNESFKYLGEATTDENGKAEIPLRINDTQLIVVKAEFCGDEFYEPSAVSEIFTNQIDVDLYAKYVSGKLNSNALNEGKLGTAVSRSESNLESKSSTNDNAGRVELGLISSLSKFSSKFNVSFGFSAAKIKVAIKSRDDSVKLESEGKDRGKLAEDEMNFNFDFEQMTLMEFLNRITMDDSPASLLVDIAEILSNPCDLPYVVHKLQIVLSKLSIALIPIVDGDGIVLYRVEVHEVVKKVAKQVEETVTEVRSKWVKRTKTVYKRVAKRIRVWMKFVKWVKQRKVITYRYWDPLKWRWVTVCQVYYVWVPKVQWKVFWKTIYETVTETVTYWVRVTETVTKKVVKTVYETVKETVRENVNVYRLKVFEGKVVDLKANKEYNIAEWLLSLVGVDVRALKEAIENKNNPLGSFVGAFGDLIGSLINFVTNLVQMFTDSLERCRKTLIDLIFSQVFYDMLGRMIVMAELARKEAEEGSSDSSGSEKVVWFDVDFDDFNLLRDLSVTRWPGGGICAFCGQWHYLPEGTKDISNNAKLYLTWKKLRGENPIVEYLMVERHLCIVKYEDGTERLAWVDKGRMNIGDDGILKYKIVEGVYADILPLGIRRTCKLIYSLSPNNPMKMTVTPMYEVVVADWAKDTINRLAEERKRIGDGEQVYLQSFDEIINSIRESLKFGDENAEVKEIEVGTKEGRQLMFLGIPTTEEQIKNLLGGENGLKEIHNANVRILAELLDGNIPEMIREKVESGELKPHSGDIKDFCISVINDKMVPLNGEIKNIIVRQHKEVCKIIEARTGEGAKLTNAQYIYAIIGEHKYRDVILLVNADPFKYGAADKNIFYLCDDTLKFGARGFENPDKLKEVATLREYIVDRLSDSTRYYRDGNNFQASLNFFYARVAQYELKTMLCGRDLNREGTEFKIGDYTEQISVAELAEIRKELANIAMREKTDGVLRYFERNERVRCIFLQVCGFKDLDRALNKKIDNSMEIKPLCEDLISRIITDNKALNEQLAWPIGHAPIEKLEVYQEVVDKGITVRQFWDAIETAARKEAGDMKEAGGVKREEKGISVKNVGKMIFRYEFSRYLLQEIFGDRVNLVEKLIRRNEKGEIEGQDFERLKEEVKQALSEKINEIPEPHRESFVEEFTRLCVKVDYHSRRLRLAGDMAKEAFGSFKYKETWVKGFVQYFIAIALFWTGILAAMTMIMVKPEPFAWLVCHDWARIGLGVGLTALFIIGLNFEGDYMKALVNPKKYFAEAMKNQIVESVKESAKKGLSLKDVLNSDKSFVITMIVGGFGTVIKELGVPFYTSDELCDMFCEWVKGFNEDVGKVLHKVLSFEIPFINQALFDLILGFLLGGPVEVIGDSIVGAVMNMLMNVINKAVTELLTVMVTQIAASTVN
jgi:hypothetical protein